MHIPCDLQVSIYLYTQVLLPPADEPRGGRVGLEDAPPLPTFAGLFSFINEPSPSPSFTPLSFQPAGGSSPTRAAEPVELQHLQSQVS